MLHAARLAWSILLLLLGAFLYACSSEQGRVYKVEAARAVHASIANLGELQSELTANFIDPQGLRQPIQDIQFASEGLHFQLSNEFILRASPYTLAEEIVAMGDPLPPYPKRASAITRVELHSQKMEGLSGIISYLQFPVYLLQSDLLSSKKDISLATPQTLIKVGYQKIKILDYDTEQEIVGASVIAVVSGEVVMGDTNQETMKAWLSPLYRPLIAKTDTSGAVMLFPLGLRDHDQIDKFYVIAWSEDYCTYVSDLLSADKINMPKIYLKKCSEAKAKQEGLKVEFGKEIPTFEEAVNGQTAKVAYTNSRQISIRVDSFLPQLRGISLRLTEGHETVDGVENPEIKAINLEKSNKKYHAKFISNLSMNLPLVFTETNSEAGDFIVHVAKLSNLHGAVDSTLESVLYGKRSSQPPSLLFVKSLKIRGPFEENILSGLAGARIYLESAHCLDGEQLGIALPGQKTIFNHCKSGVASFLAEDIGIASSSMKVGGKARVSVFLKDRFGNISEQDAARSNQRQVFLDYGIPDLSKNPLKLGIDIGFAYATQPKGTDEVPFNYGGSSQSEQALEPIVLSVLNFERQVVFRFRSPKYCKTKSQDLAEGVSDGNDGIRVLKFLLTSNQNLADSNAFVSCIEEGFARDLPIKKDMLVFPENSDEDAFFYLRVLDAAGHMSQPYRYTIPACQASTEIETAFCWQN